MKSYKIIDMEEFDRADYFQYFMSVGTTIQFTMKIDVTNAVQKCYQESISFHAYTVFKIYKAMNSIQNFRYDILDGNVVEWEKIIPTFSSFNKKSKLFFTLCEEPMESYIEFDKRYKSVTAKYADSNTIVPQMDLPLNIFNISCIPWMHFEHYSSNSKTQENKITKMITFGKYEEINSKLVMPITIQISHAIADGYHVSMFFKNLQDEMNQK